MVSKNVREKQRFERREQILACALDMIISRGFGAMKIRDIADRLHISTGLFFNYFASKEQVYEELVKIGLSGPTGVLALNTRDISPIELFERMTAVIFDAIGADAFTGKMFLLMAGAMRYDTVPGGVKNLLKGFDYVTPLMEVVRAGQALGQIKQGDARALIAAYWGAVQGIAESCAMDNSIPLPESGWIVDIVRA